MYEDAEFDELLGKTLERVVVDPDTSSEGETIWFYCTDGSVYKMYHGQWCCEYVSLESIDGDIQRLLHLPILRAEVVTNEDQPAPEGRANWLNRWTFYKLATNLDSVTIRWFGSSNGYYSVDVDFGRVKNPTGGEA